MKRWYCIALILLLFPAAVCARSQSNGISISPKWGWYFPNKASWWREGAAQRRYSFFGGIEPTFELLPSSEVGLGICYLRESWKRASPQDPNQRLKNYISMLPINLSLNYKFKFSKKQLFIPYVGTGFDYIYVKEYQITTVRFHRYGYHFSLGGRIMLNRFQLQEDEMGIDKKYGINLVYFFLETRYADMDTFGELEGHDISGWFHSMGILIGF